MNGRLLNVLATVAGCCLLALGQQQPKQSPRPPSTTTTKQPSAGDEDVVRITTNLVQIDATVTDKSGKQITNLRPEDFEVLQDGRQQKITNLSYIATPAFPTQLATKSNTLSKANTPPMPPVSLRP